VWNFLACAEKSWGSEQMPVKNKLASYIVTTAKYSVPNFSLHALFVDN
jgi:hypothetical protein